MAKISSPYYPPRARWHSPLASLAYGLQRKLGLERIGLRTDLSLSATLASLFIPAIVFYLRGHRFWGKLLMSAAGVLLLVFLAGLGYPAGNLAFGCLLSLHVTSVTFLFEPWLRTLGMRYRLLASIGCLFAFGGGLYMPARNLIQDHWFMPLRINQHVIVISVSERCVKCGDLVAYRMGVAQGQQVYSEEGFGFGPVLAGPGDHIRFNPGEFRVNGVPFPAQPQMPVSGELDVPQKHWFIWPNVSMNVHGNVSHSAISSTMLQLACVSDKQLMGKPFKRWFGRRQLSS